MAEQWVTIGSMPKPDCQPGSFVNLGGKDYEVLEIADGKCRVKQITIIPVEIVTEDAKVKPNNQPTPGPIANTTGIIVPKTDPNVSGSTTAPAIKPETPKEKGFWEKWGETTHTILDIGGAIPVVGIFSDGINAAIYTAEGNYVQAGISGVSAAANLIPGGGAAVKGGKLAIKGGKALLKAEAKLAAKEAAQLAAKKAAEKEAAELAAKNAAK